MKRAKNWTQEATITFIEVWTDYYVRLTQGGSRHTPIYESMAKDLNGMLPGRSLNGADIKSKVGNLVTEYRRKKKGQGKTGASPSSWPYYESIDRLLGKFDHFIQELDSSYSTIHLGERPYNDDSLLCDSIVTEEDQCSKEINRAAMAEGNMTQVAEEAIDCLPIPIDVEELEIETIQTDNIPEAAGLSSAKQTAKGEIEDRIKSKIIKHTPKNKKRISELK